MTGPNFDDVAGFFDCADKVYRAADGSFIAVTRRSAGWRVEECSFIEDDEEGAGTWVDDEDQTFPTARAAVLYLRSIGAARKRTVYDALA
jgi:hypothetical protein